MVKLSFILFLPEGATELFAVLNAMLQTAGMPRYRVFYLDDVEATTKTTTTMTANNSKLQGFIGYFTQPKHNHA